MKFFRPEDFNGLCNYSYPAFAADMANAKLEREGKIVYGSPNGRSHTFVPGIIWNTHDDKTGRDTHKALLINIEPIEVCKHEKEKVGTFIQKKVFIDYNNLPPIAKRDSQYLGTTQVEYVCQCGKKLIPTSFDEEG